MFTVAVCTAPAGTLLVPAGSSRPSACCLVGRWPAQVCGQPEDEGGGVERTRHAQGPAVPTVAQVQRGSDTHQRGRWPTAGGHAACSGWCPGVLRCRSRLSLPIPPCSSGRWGSNLCGCRRCAVGAARSVCPCILQSSTPPLPPVPQPAQVEEVIPASVPAEGGSDGLS